VFKDKVLNKKIVFTKRHIPNSLYSWCEVCKQSWF